MRHVPLLVIPFLVYNGLAFLIFPDSAVDFRASELGSMPMASGATYVLTVGDSLIVLALLFLSVEVVKAARIGRGSITDHVFATMLFIAYLVEFLLLPQAATGIFVILMVIALADLVCGFAVSIRTATRDVNFGG